MSFNLLLYTLVLYYVIYYKALYSSAESDRGETTFFFRLIIPTHKDAVEVSTTSKPINTGFRTRHRSVSENKRQNVFKNYSNYMAIAIKPASPEELRLVLQFELRGTKYNFWPHRRVLNSPITILLPSNDTELRKQLQQHRIDYRILTEDVQRNFVAEIKNTGNARRFLTGISFNSYFRYDFITKYLKHMSEKYSHIVKLINVGKTVENRDITMVKIASPTNSKIVVGNVLLEAGMHGREWLSVSLAVYAINQLVEHAAVNANMLYRVVWYILPVLNPDGYEYAHTVDRLWKNNRRPYGKCHGVDLNRNFKVSEFKKPRKLTCTNLFDGKTPDSEPETKALENVISRFNVTAYISLHSGDAFIAQPWAHKSETTIDYDTVEKMAIDVKEAIEQYDNSSEFVVGTLHSICGKFYGAAIDWAKEHGVTYSLMISLKGPLEKGFEVQSENIYESVVAAFEGLRAIAVHLHEAALSKYITGRRNLVSEESILFASGSESFSNVPKSVFFRLIPLYLLFAYFID